MYIVEGVLEKAVRGAGHVSSHLDLLYNFMKLFTHTKLK